MDESFGELTIADLALRADAAWTVYFSTFTAVDVLHRVWAVALESDDPKNRDYLSIHDTVVERIMDYREAARRSWRQCYIAWAHAAGYSPDDIFPNADGWPE